MCSELLISPLLSPLAVDSTLREMLPTFIFEQEKVEACTVADVFIVEVNFNVMARLRTYERLTSLRPGPAKQALCLSNCSTDYMTVCHLLSLCKNDKTVGLSYQEYK